MVDDHETE